MGMIMGWSREDEVARRLAELRAAMQRSTQHFIGQLPPEEQLAHICERVRDELCALTGRPPDKVVVEPVGADRLVWSFLE